MNIRIESQIWSSNFDGKRFACYEDYKILGAVLWHSELSHHFPKSLHWFES